MSDPHGTEGVGVPWFVVAILTALFIFIFAARILEYRYMQTRKKEAVALQEKNVQIPTKIDAETLKRLEGKACHPAPWSHSGCLVVEKSGEVLLLNAHHMGFEGGRVELRLRAIAPGHKDPTNVYAGDQITFEELQKRFKKVVFRDDPDYAWYAEGYFTRQGR